MKIGIDCRIDSTGIGRYNRELVQNLGKLDSENEYILFVNELGIFEARENIREVLVGAEHYSFAEQIKFPRILKEEKLDLMHFTHFNAPLLYRGKSVVTIHDLILNFYPNKFYNRKRSLKSRFNEFCYKFVIEGITKRSKKIIAVSENTKKDLVDILGIHPEKITVVHNGLSEKFHVIEDQKLLEETREKYGLDKPFLLYTGVWRSHKNLLRLLEAFGHLQDKIDHYLILTGKPDYPEITDKIEELKLEKRIKTVGAVPEEDLLALYNLAETYVFPSLYEGFGLPPLEAMSCGTPVVASNITSIPEVCSENALYFDPKNVEDMAEKIHRICTDQNLREKLVESGLKHVKNFSWKKMAEETLRVYKSLL
ncbi:MAG TPA: glycosyltransferase family 1 protein [Candidatus Peregrinibacteria bacterium]|nr:glycosyltransferase family 1 protein [Candidatus Peregrinibacteria bacterium]